jgi:hypothetical protein
MKMHKSDFLEKLRVDKKAWVRCYLSSPNIDPNKYPFKFQPLHIQEHNRSISLITPSVGWAEYSPIYDIDGFDGTVMTFIAEEYVMEVRF